MKHFLLTLAVLLVTFSDASAQTLSKEPLSVRSTFGSVMVTQGDKTLNLNEASQAFASHEPALQEFRKAKTNNTWATIMGGIGGALVGWPVGAALAGGEANWTLAGVGAGFIGISIPFTVKANKQTRNAVNLYNTAAASTLVKPAKIQYQFKATGTGLGFALNF
ncbi:hypothetical protein [Rufibacter sp. LB8]|uniref:hypothetical protein n=1 Tax=Rufibacter sp. LB8 TaxID=2777781 RepID=UPI00178C6EA4|nr:hypothetical protein [Rufibacter sp. LB8]